VCPAGTLLFRGHTLGLSPNWFGPAIGKTGSGRWDVPFRGPGDPGVCYLAPTLEGALLERVIRDVWRPEVHLTSTMKHGLSRCVTTRDLLLFDLLQAHYTIYEFEISDITQDSYAVTQAWAQTRAQQTVPVAADGIAYGSRFSVSTECIALWDRAANALDWIGTPEPFGTDVDELDAVCTRLGLTLVRDRV
jgi:hypothetical protein